MMSADEDDVIAAAAYYVLLSGEYLLTRKKKKVFKRRCWMGALNRSRGRCNATDMLNDLRSQPSIGFENFCRMSETDFEYLLSRIGPLIARQNTNMRSCIPIQERLAVALRFFSSGDSYSSLSNLFKVSKQTISRCVDEVCLAIMQELKNELKLPTNEEEWIKMTQEYESIWNFPNCLGSIGGKHIVMQCPINTNSEFYNYKGTYSVVLIALVDANYKFTFVDIGCQDQVFNNSSLFSKLQKGRLHLPSERKLPLFDEPLPYVFIGDSAFELSRHMIKPYPGIHEQGSPERVFGYRLSRARGVLENVFGIMASVFRVFRRPMVLEPQKVCNVTLACILLHNFMRRSPSSATLYTPAGTFDTEVDGELIPGEWRKDNSVMTSFLPLKKSKKPEIDGKADRDSFATYFTTSGKLPWQDKYC